MFLYRRNTICCSPPKYLYPLFHTKSWREEIHFDNLSQLIYWPNIMSNHKLSTKAQPKPLSTSLCIINSTDVIRLLAWNRTHKLFPLWCHKFSTSSFLDTPSILRWKITKIEKQLQPSYLKYMHLNHLIWKPSTNS